MNYFPSLAVIAFVSYFEPKVIQYDYNDPFFNDPFFNDPFFSTLCSGATIITEASASQHCYTLIIVI
ncbi:hypothetical protein BgiBS90_018992, partial [Biomphalaria glabrata]